MINFRLYAPFFFIKNWDIKKQRVLGIYAKQEQESNQ